MIVLEAVVTAIILINGGGGGGGGGDNGEVGKNDNTNYGKDYG
jgi:hypothetical protein